MQEDEKTSKTGIIITYGSGTNNAMKLFQSAYALSSDGIVGTGTWNKMYTLRGSWMFVTN